MNITNSDLKEIYNRFRAEGTYSSWEAVGSGHIHDTYLVKTLEEGSDDYILQRLNNRVFRNIEQLQSNIERVTTHIQNKLRNIPGSDIRRECLTLVPSIDGKSWIRDKEGSYWRMFLFIPRHRSYDIVDGTEKAYEGGKAVGKFQAMLADMPGEPLFETIPSFHNVERRLDTFMETVKKDPLKRSGVVKKEIKMIFDRAEDMKIILKLGREGLIPVRITHNDTKFNNVLLDENDKALCIIDLDTVMPGYVLYDFGDAIRTGANTAAEDEKDLKKISMDLNLYEAYAAGYLSEVSSVLNNAEKQYLAFGPKLLTYSQSVRFLTDYIDGDKYYKIHYEEHNLDRTKAQLKLLTSMEEQYEEMKRIIRQKA